MHDGEECPMPSTLLDDVVAKRMPFPKGVDLGFETTDMLFGPFDLDLAGAGPFTHGTNRWPLGV